MNKAIQPPAAVVLVSVETLTFARELAHTLVKEHLIACAHCLPAGISIYRWQGDIHEAEEIQLLLKTRMKLTEDVVARVKTLHPYDVPEILVLPVTKGLPEYLRWIEDCTHEKENI